MCCSDTIDGDCSGVSWLTLSRWALIVVLWVVFIAITEGRLVCQKTLLTLAQTCCCFKVNVRLVSGLWLEAGITLFACSLSISGLFTAKRTSWLVFIQVVAISWQCSALGNGWVCHQRASLVHSKVLTSQTLLQCEVTASVSFSCATISPQASLKLVSLHHLSVMRGMRIGMMSVLVVSAHERVSFQSDSTSWRSSCT